MAISLFGLCIFFGKIRISLLDLCISSGRICVLLGEIPISSKELCRAKADFRFLLLTKRRGDSRQHCAKPPILVRLNPMKAEFVPLSSATPPRSVRRRRASRFAVWMRLILLWPLVLIWMWFVVDSLLQFYVLKAGHLERAIVINKRLSYGRRGGKWILIKYRVGSDSPLYSLGYSVGPLPPLSLGATFPVRTGRSLLGTKMAIPIIGGQPSPDYHTQINFLCVSLLVGSGFFYFNVVQPAFITRLVMNGVATQGIVTQVERQKNTRWLHYKWEDEKGELHQSQQNIRVWVPTRFQEGQAVQVLFYPGTSKSTVHELAEYEVAP